MAENIKLPIGLEEIKKIIPHRDPFLFIEEVTNFSDMQWIEGTKRVRPDEYYFAGHFPGRPIMPGVIILETLAQLGAIFAKLVSGGASSDRLVVFSGAESVRFRRPVVPGDILQLRMELVKNKFGHWKMKGTARVGDEMATEGILMATEVK